jgi:dTDP-4-dehydrorhamnose 3,5-epimerase
MKITPLNISDVLLIEPDIYEDSRGFFFESFNHRKFEKIIGRKIQFVQDNHSKSYKGVLRGLHYQNLQSQAKLVRVVRGEVFDVAVDIRKNSLTYGKWVAATLSEENKKQLWIPEGFAHGFLALSNVAEVLYKASDYYAPESERCIIWNDPNVNIEWPIKSLPILSVKDQQGNVLGNIK